MRFLFLVSFFSLGAFADELRVVRVHDGVTKEPYLVGGVPVVNWTIVVFEGGGAMLGMHTGTSEPALFFGEHPCFLVWRGLKGWCVVPRVEDANRQRLWGPFEVEVGQQHRMDSQEIARLKKANEGKGAPASAAPVGPTLSGATITQFLYSLGRE